MEDPREDRGWRAVRDILSYEPDRDVWTKQAEMKFPRLSHGVSAVSVTEEIMRACRTERTVVDNSVYGGVTLIITSQHCCYLGMLITGGYGDPHSRMALRSAEVFLPSSNSSCRLGEMRWARYRHSQTGPLVCGGEGGEDSRGSCELSGGGGWTREVRLQSGGGLGISPGLLTTPSSSWETSLTRTVTPPPRRSLGPTPTPRICSTNSGSMLGENLLALKIQQEMTNHPQFVLRYRGC